MNSALSYIVRVHYILPVVALHFVTNFANSYHIAWDVHVYCTLKATCLWSEYLYVTSGLGLVLIVYSWVHPEAGIDQSS